MKIKVRCDYCEKEVYKKEWTLKHHKNSFCSLSCWYRFYSEITKIIFKCDYCSKINIKNKSRIRNAKHHFCNRKCFGRWYSININKKIETKCDYCDKIVYKYLCHIEMHKCHFCNSECKNKYFEKYGLGKSRKVCCKQCGKEFTLMKCYIKKNGNCCSRKCYSKWMKLNWKGKSNPHYGHKWSKKSRLSMSKNWHKAIKRVKHLNHLNKTKKRHGKNNPNWLDGISFEPYGYEFDDSLKEFIRKRDQYRCQNEECGIPEKECSRKLTTHHVDYRKTNNDPINLIALCTSCNAKANYNRKYWQNYYENIQIKRRVHELEKYVT